jgi:hypothetical protein
VIFHYGVYGLAIEADAPIDGAPAAEFSTPDIRVRMQAMPPFAPRAPLFDDENVTIFRDGDAYLFQYRDGTRFLIDGATIWSTWPESSTPEDTATYLLGPVLAFVLRRRGTLSLHASAVAIDGRAVAIAAPPSGGKSTTAAAFAARGARVLTEDVLPIAWRDSVPWALSGYPRIRLWPETVIARHGAADALPLLTPTWTKRYLDLGAQFQGDPQPLGAIVVLRERVAGPPRIAPLSGHEAAMQLIANSSMALYLDAAMRAAELEAVGALVECVPVFVAWPGEEIARVDELCEAILSALTG